MNNLYLIYILSNMIDDIYDSKTNLFVNYHVNNSKDVWIDKTSFFCDNVFARGGVIWNLMK